MTLRENRLLDSGFIIGKIVFLHTESEPTHIPLKMAARCSPKIREQSFCFLSRQFFSNMTLFVTEQFRFDRLAQTTESKRKSQDLTVKGWSTCRVEKLKIKQFNPPKKWPRKPKQKPGNGPIPAITLKLPWGMPHNE